MVQFRPWAFVYCFQTRQILSTEVFKSIINKAKLPSALLIISPDKIIKERVVGKIFDHFFKSKPQYSCIEAEELNKQSLNKIKEEASSFGFFSDTNLYLVKDIEDLKGELATQFVDVIKETESTAHFIVTANKLPATNPLLKYLKPKDLILNFETPKGYDLKRWILKELNNLGIKNYPDRLIDQLIEMGDSLPDQILPLLERLALYVENDKIVESDLKSLFSEQYIANEFDLIDLITSGKLARAHVESQKLIKSGKIPLVLLALLSKTFSNYLIINALKKENINSSQIRAMMGLSPWIFNKTFEGSGKYTLEKAKQNVKALLNADSKLKNRSLGAEVIFAELIDELSS